MAIRRTERRGSVLPIVLGVLALLSLLGVAFLQIAAAERRVARSHLDAVRARLLASSGVQHALAELEDGLRTGDLMSRVRHDEPPPPRFVASGTYQVNGDSYAFRISDASSRLNVNDGAAGGPDRSVSRNLRRILNVLGAQPTVDVPHLGDRVLEGRPKAGYVSVFDLPLGREALERVRPHLTVDSWSDPNVANPVPLEAERALYPVHFSRPEGDGGPIHRYGHQRNFRGALLHRPLLFFDPSSPDPSHNAVWGRDSLNPQWIETVSRSPVNVNTASREVLMALLVDLEGFFLVERRRAAPRGIDADGAPCASPGGAYGWTALRYSYDGAGSEGDECGFLYRTRPLTGPGGRPRDGIPAAAVVDEIVACREGKSSPGIADLDYGRAPFGGPFRTWARFNLFVDALVRGGLLVDDRAWMFWDYDPAGRAVAGSPWQMQAASEAVGDVLKANFNPNLHLNEINPDRSLFAHVDKTDLLVHSTEFCFTPMGAFEIESAGRVARPDGADAGHEVVVRARLFDAARETTQAQFHAGSLPERGPGPETNNNRGLETGPEPDNGPAPAENRAEGYLQLPTYGSNLTHEELKPGGELWTAISDPSIYPGAKGMAPGGRQLGAVIHAHFQLDHVAHHHAGHRGATGWDGFRLPLGAWQTEFGSNRSIMRNWEDRTETLPSPYSPVGTGRHRIARSFTFPPPPAVETAPSDLRLDGAYVERDSAFGYWIDENVSFNFNEGTVSFWWKPGFFPEMTGKRRTLLSAGRYHAHARDVMNPSPFALFWVPALGGDPEGVPSYFDGPSAFRPHSLAFGLGFSSMTGYNWETSGRGDPATHHAFAFTPTLLGDSVRAHRWTHVAVTWKNPLRRLPTPDTVRIYVNGRIVPGSVGIPHLIAGRDERGVPMTRTPPWTTHSLQVEGPGGAQWCQNAIRLGGEPSMLFDLPGEAGLFPGNFTADSTFDEFYLWPNRAPSSLYGGLGGAQAIWSRGRYYRPDDRDPGDARFVSAPLVLCAASPRRAPPAAGSTPVDPPRPRVRVLGVSWTLLAEDYDPQGRPRMVDYSTDPPEELEAGADLWIRADGVEYGPLRDDGFSPVKIPAAAEATYAAKLKAGCSGRPGAILLASPVLDDVTVYYDPGGPRIIGWTVPKGGF